MADIYENAFITIAATRSPNSSRGCFADTDSRFIAAPVSGYSGVYVRVLTPRWPPIWAMHDSKMPEWPLLTRGWVYQELRLSTRILHFGPEEVTWECASQRRCESGLNDEDWAADDAYYDTQGYASWPYWRLEREPLLLWHRTVHEYSGLRLSFETDKLVALSALTKRMEELRVNDRYILGLWEKTLLLDLLWNYEYLPSPELTAVFPSMNSNFPSWTWASRENPVGWKSHLTTTLASVCVKGINYTPCGPRHMGFPSGAEIVLQAPLVESRQLVRNVRSTLERLSRCQPDRGPDLLGRASRLSSVPDHPDANVLLEELDVEAFWNDEKVCYQHLYDGVLDEGTGATAEESLQRYFLPIGISPPGTGDRVWAIQVQRKPGTDKFQRVGFGAVSHVMAYEADLRDEAGRLRIDSDISVEVLRTLRGRVTAILDRMPTQTITLV
ncbi:uncharacterized protein E0L32_010956 [Thyridium curvatum]|uniref:Heterokaryon incompatibility domain-containing protein n=1 Tax=Thyridium curvatum TaxID=1093900 RepID=A0A507ADL8_9PEZI|nr:uncharacterized protein E0L32_010956 [Thyridium curvatum]TPX07155.1 hypothetical protein E0L32_010956 [Thyridium curvatum]